MKQRETNADDAATLALRALAWTIADDDRAGRFLALTGLDGATLRERAASPPFLAAVIAHLEGHEADLIACSDALEVAPETLVAARHILES